MPSLGNAGGQRGWCARRIATCQTKHWLSGKNRRQYQSTSFRRTQTEASRRARERSGATTSYTCSRWRGLCANWPIDIDMSPKCEPSHSTLLLQSTGSIKKSRSHREKQLNLSPPCRPPRWGTCLSLSSTVMHCSPFLPCPILLILRNTPPVPGSAPNSQKGASPCAFLA